MAHGSKAGRAIPGPKISPEKLRRAEERSKGRALAGGLGVVTLGSVEGDYREGNEEGRTGCRVETKGRAEGAWMWGKEVSSFQRKGIQC